MVDQSTVLYLLLLFLLVWEARSIGILYIYNNKKKITLNQTLMVEQHS